VKRTAAEDDRLFRSVVESAPVGVVVVDREGVIAFANSEVETLFGYAQGELAGQPLERLVPMEVRTAHTTMRAQLLAAHGARSMGAGRDLVGLRKDGVEIPVEIGLRQIDSGGNHYVVATVADIRERQRTEQVVLERDERFQALIEATFDGISISQDGVLMEVNEGYARIFGYTTAAELAGKAVLDLVAEESTDEMRRRLSEQIEGSYDLVGKKRDGTKVWLQATTRMHRVGGRPSRVTAMRDMTEQRLLEQQLRHAQKMEAVGRLAGGIAHDFNNLLTVIQSYASLLISEAAGTNAPHEELEEIQRAAEAATTLTRQLLTFSRQQVIEPKVLTVDKIVSGAHKMLKRLIGEDVELEIKLAPDGGRIRVDPGQLEQVIMNLAVNARDAMPEGGRLLIETSNVEMSEQFLREHVPARAGHYLMLAMSDTGAGMSEETRAHIFEPFFTTKEAGKGTGLGLATVYAIVKQSGGFIWVYSEPGHGTVFKLYFPLVDDPAEISGPTRAAGAARGTETVLLVEDSAAVRAVTRQLLERQGYTVLEAPDPRMAIAIASSHRGTIHLLLTDIVMPGMSGRALAEQLSKARPKMKVLYTSGYTDDTILRQGVIDGSAAFLQKPFTPEMLLRKVRSALRSTPPRGEPKARG
jgi:PAS domain S-box-containing protein